MNISMKQIKTVGSIVLFFCLSIPALSQVIAASGPEVSDQLAAGQFLEDGKPEIGDAQKPEEFYWINPDLPGPWIHIDSPETYLAYDFIINPQNPAHFLLASSDPDHPVYYTYDYGKNWEVETEGLPQALVRRLAFDPSSPNTVYAAVELGKGIYRSDDGGLSWSEKNNGIYIGPEFYSELVVHPVNPDIVFAGSGRSPVIYRSENRGDSWTEIRLQETPWSYVKQIVTDPFNPSKIIALLHPTNVGISEFYISTDTGLTWNKSGENTNSLAFNPDIANFIYRSASGYLYKSEDGGESWELISDSGSFGPGNLLVDPMDGNILYSPSGSNPVARSTDGGVHWYYITDEIELYKAPNSWAFAIDPKNTKRIYTFSTSDVIQGLFVNEYTHFHGAFVPIVSQPCDPIYADNFSNPSSGWLVADNDDHRTDYYKEEYRMLVRPANSGVYSYPGFQASDYTVSVDLRNVSGKWGSYGILFGMSKGGYTAYSLEIYPDGWYGLYRWDPESYTILSEAFSPLINQGTATNQIKVVRDGSSIKAFANGQQLVNVEDATYTGTRYLGLIEFSYEEPKLEVYYDNYLVMPIMCKNISSTSISDAGWQQAVAQRFFQKEQKGHWKNP
jgi:photosystem II stability/assembly factor-like uncharacterized protein